MISVETRDPKKKSMVPEKVEIKINGSTQTISWQQFTQLASCCHEFETNSMPQAVTFGEVTVRMK